MPEFTLQERTQINAAAAAQQKNIYRQLKATRNKTFAINLIRTVHHQIDSHAAKRKKDPGVHFDCKPGCNSCCSLRVEVLPPEAFLIARELSKLPEPALSELKARVASQAAYANGLTMGQFRRPCALLVDGRCSIYAVRPSMCRKLYSQDVEMCKIHGAEIPEDPSLFMQIAVITVGANDGYGQAKFPNFSHELGQALLVALTDDQAEERWYRGEQVFPMLPDSD